MKRFGLGLLAVVMTGCQGWTAADTTAAIKTAIPIIKDAACEIASAVVKPDGQDTVQYACRIVDRSIGAVGNRGTDAPGGVGSTYASEVFFVDVPVAGQKEFEAKHPPLAKE